MTSRMKGDYHVQICERLIGKFPLPTRLLRYAESRYFEQKDLFQN
jgi:hypothetical protein